MTSFTTLDVAARVPTEPHIDAVIEWLEECGKSDTVPLATE